MTMEGKSLLNHKASKRKPFNLTVEPTLLFHILVFNLSDTVFQNMLLFLTCKDVDYSDMTCDSETESQLLVSQLLTVKAMGLTLIAIIVTIYVGSFIDKHVKYIRWFLFLGPVSQLVLDAVHCINITFFRWSVTTTTIYATLFTGAGGQLITIMVVSATYIAHCTTKQERTARISYILFAFTFGYAFGVLAGGYAVEYLGYFYSYLACISFGSCGLVWGILFVREVDHVPKDASSSNVVMQFTEGIKVLQKMRLQNKRLMLYLIIVAFILIHDYPYGELSVLYLYVRKEFNWDSVTFGTYIFYRMMIKCGGLLLTSDILKRRLKLRDSTIGLIGSVCELCYTISWFIVNETWQIYAAAMLGLFEKSVSSTLYVLASKCVELEEYGRIMSVLGATNILLPVAIAIYNAIYELTIDIYPTAIFLLSVGLCMPLIVMFSILSRLECKIPVHEIPTEKQIESS